MCDSSDSTFANSDYVKPITLEWIEWFVPDRLNCSHPSVCDTRGSSPSDVNKSDNFSHVQCRVI